MLLVGRLADVNEKRFALEHCCSVHMPETAVHLVIQKTENAFGLQSCHSN